MLGLALSVLSADFLKPYIRWLPLGVTILFAVLFTASYTVVITRKAGSSPWSHWFSLSCLLGLFLSLGMLLLAIIKTSPAKPDVGVSAQLPDLRDAQLKLLPLTEDTRDTLLTIGLPTDPNEFRIALRKLYMSDDRILQERALLLAVKSSEGKNVPLTVIERDGSRLASFLIGSSVTITSVDLKTSSFVGTFNTGHSAGLSGTINAAGLQFSSAVTGPGFGAFALQVRLSPSRDFLLTGKAIGAMGTDSMVTEVELGLSF